MSIDVSVIIPCYNSGRFLSEAIESIDTNCNNITHEIIVIDDGSTDLITINLLEELSNKHYQIIHQENKGPASARNTGVKNSKGEYLFFLDSDNKIKDGYLEKGLKFLRDDKAVGVVYANPIFFGTTIDNRYFITKSFKIENLLLGNYIDMCSLVRRKAWESVGGLDENLIGHEDWEFWISLHKKEWKFVHINEELFYYRITDGSLTTIVDSQKDIPRIKYIHQKHHDLFIETYYNLLSNSDQYNEDKKKPVRSFFKFMYHKYFSKK